MERIDSMNRRAWGGLPRAASSAVSQTQTGAVESGQAAAPPGEGELHLDVEALLRRLQSAYPGLRIYTGSVPASGVERFARDAGAGMHLVLSQKFLDGMRANRALFEEGSALLEETARQLRDSMRAGAAGVGAILDENALVQWTMDDAPEFPPTAGEREAESQLLQSLLDNLERMKESSKARKVHINKPNANPAGELARLARAETVLGTRDVLMSVQHTAFRLRLCLGIGAKSDDDAVRASIRSMDKVAARAKSKIKNLQSEATADRQRKRAAEERQREKERRIEAELKKRRAARRGREFGWLREGVGGGPYEWERRSAGAGDLGSGFTAPVVPAALPAADPLAGANAAADPLVGANAAADCAAER